MCVYLVVVSDFINLKCMENDFACQENHAAGNLNYGGIYGGFLKNNVY